MTARRGSVALCALLLALLAPAGAFAQSDGDGQSAAQAQAEPTPTAETPLSQDPPDTLPSDETPDPDPTPEPLSPSSPEDDTPASEQAGAGDLPATGGEALSLGLLGAALLLAGAGLRLRLDAVYRFR